jgi:hypothetical protein
MDRTSSMSPAAGASVKETEAPKWSAVRPATDAASAEPAELAELFQLNA